MALELEFQLRIAVHVEPGGAVVDLSAEAAPHAGVQVVDGGLAPADLGRLVPVAGDDVAAIDGREIQLLVRRIGGRLAEFAGRLLPVLVRAGHRPVGIGGEFLEARPAERTADLPIPHQDAAIEAQELSGAQEPGYRRASVGSS